MTLRIPTSDRARLDTLDKILILSEQGVTAPTPATPDPLEPELSGKKVDMVPDVTLPADLFREVEECRLKMYNHVHETKSIQQMVNKDRAQRANLIKEIRAQLRNYGKALSLYIETNPEADNPLAFYGFVDFALTKYSALQVLRTSEQLLSAAETAEAAGFPVITLGRAQTVFAENVASLADILGKLGRAADDKTAQKQERMLARSECSRVLRKVAAFLRYAYHDFGEVDTREKMRAYGFKVVQRKRRDGPADAASGQDVSDANATDTGIVGEVSDPTSASP